MGLRDSPCPATRTGPSWREVCLVLLATSAYLLPFVRVQWRIGDEGTIVYGAARVADGAVPFRDFFEVMGPFAFCWLASWFKLFGTHWAVARVLLLATGAATASLLYWITFYTYGRYAAVLATSICVVLGISFWPGNSHHWDSNLFFLVGLAAVIAWQPAKGTAAPAVAGLAAGATAGFMFPKGVLLLVAVWGTLAWRSLGHDRTWRQWVGPITAATAGFLFVIGAVVLWFVRAGAAADLYSANVLWPRAQYGGINSLPYGFGLHEWLWPSWVRILEHPMPHWAALAVAGIFSVPLLVLISLPLVAAATIVLGLWRRWGSVDHTVVSLWVGAAALWVSETHRPDVFHLMYGSPLLLAAVVGEAASRYGPGLNVRRALVTAVALCSICLGTWNATVAVAATQRQDTRRGTVRVFRADGALRFLNEQLRAGELVFVYPYYPMYYFLAGVDNPTRYSILVYGYNTRAQFLDAVKDLEMKRPHYVLWDTSVAGDKLKTWFPAYANPTGNELIMERYLTEQYEQVGLENGFRILVRTQGAGARQAP